MHKVHHLNCGTLCPIGGKLLLGTHAKLVCHCLLVESDQGLVLVDTGFGLKDIANANRRLGALMVKFGRPRLDPDETAIRQVQRLGYKARDVTDIVLTHLDLDHAGGISDFPSARIHIFGPEYIAAMAPATLLERMRYRPLQWAHSPGWKIHKVTADHHWFELESVSPVTHLKDDLRLVPLTGHTLGHCGVAVRSLEKWILHAGDSYIDHNEIRAEGHRPAKFPFNAFQALLQVDAESRIHNQERLRHLKKQHSNEIEIFCSHDPAEFSPFLETLENPEASPQLT